MKQTPRLAITLGDPCGIGPEILLKTLPVIAQKWRITVYGSAVGLSILPSGGFKYEFHNNKLCTGSLEIPWVDPLPGLSPDDLQIGVPCALSGKCAVESVRSAALDIMSGKADAMLTLPLSKAAAHKAGYHIPGHTELLQTIVGVPRTQMAFLSPSLNVVLHTAHKSLRAVIEELNSEAVAETLIFTAQQFIALAKMSHIKIALCALNPHAGESRAFGKEELLLEESVKIARKFFDEPSCVYGAASVPGCGYGIASVPGQVELPEANVAQPTLYGPYPADTIFLRALRGDFDVVVALYHDQGLIPIKLLEPERAVNLTLGLPFIRTSPDHGTAFEIAGKWIANPNNTLAASELAFSLLG
ncbi:MAG: 4-hydroxythreonine-4-phosphate dehydrogenase PdxA [Holophagales bacterium]|jgi:4-hydroxythreonine-4-phosphate dehydrogenase|nr:4-hydroxythreonine-4-phosphate dehydrogenase PdxA [Holophagales bacterium]